jgi:hypothetical protein
MKLATYKDGSRDGQLVVVSRDLSMAHYATGIASKLQQVLDDWNFLAPQLEDLYTTLNQGKARHAFPFDPEQCMAPLPRAYQWADGSAYLNHVELVRAARNSEVPASFYTDPLMYQGGSDDFLGPTDEARFPSEEAGIDFEALDNAPVHFIILFVVPRKDYHLHLRTLAAIAKMFTNCEVRRKLAAAECRDEILEILDPKPVRNGANA